MEGKVCDSPKQAAVKELRGKYPLPGVEKCYYCAEYHRHDAPCCAMAELALKDEQIKALRTAGNALEDRIGCGCGELPCSACSEAQDLWLSLQPNGYRHSGGFIAR